MKFITNNMEQTEICTKIIGKINQILSMIPNSAEDEIQNKIYRLKDVMIRIDWINTGNGFPHIESVTKLIRYGIKDRNDLRKGLRELRSHLIDRIRDEQAQAKLAMKIWAELIESKRRFTRDELREKIGESDPELFMRSLMYLSRRMPIRRDDLVEAIG